MQGDYTQWGYMQGGHPSRLRFIALTSLIFNTLHLQKLKKSSIFASSSIHHTTQRKQGAVVVLFHRTSCRLLHPLLSIEEDAQRNIKQYITKVKTSYKITAFVIKSISIQDTNLT